MLLFRNSSTVSLFLCRLRTAQPSQTQSRSQYSTCCCAGWKWSVFLQVYSLIPDDRPERKRKGSSKNRNTMWKTYYWLKILQASKMKTKNQFQGYCQCNSWVRSLSVSWFCNIKVSGSFLDGTNLQIDRGVTRLDGARGKMQVWRPHFRTWGLPEANVLYWRMYVWHCWDFLAPPEWFGARVIAPPWPFITPLLIEP